MAADNGDLRRRFASAAHRVISAKRGFPSAGAEPCTLGRKMHVEFANRSVQVWLVPHSVDSKELLQELKKKGRTQTSPSLVLSIMGSTANLKVDDAKFDMSQFRQSVVEFAVKTGAWLFTGGVDAGVDEQIGLAIRDHDPQRGIPCVGITAIQSLTPGWQKLLKSNELEQDPYIDEARVESIEDMAAPSKEPEPNHSHLIIVDSIRDDSRVLEFQSNLRADLEKHASPPLREDHVPRTSLRQRQSLIANNIVAGSRPRASSLRLPSSSSTLESTSTYVRASSHNKLGTGDNLCDDIIDDVLASNCFVPRVLVVVEGDLVTLKSVRNALDNDYTVVVCSGSGQAADAIATLVCGGTEGQALQQMPELQADDLGGLSFLKQIEMRKESVHIHRNSGSLEDVILSSVLKSRCDEPTEKLEQLKTTWHQLVLAVKWQSVSHYEELGSNLIQDCIACLKEKESRGQALQIARDGHELAIRIIFKGFLDFDTKYTCAHKHMKKDSLENVVPLLKWLFSKHCSHIHRLWVTKRLGAVRWDMIGGRKWHFSFEGLLVWCAEREAPGAVLEEIWLQTEDPVHAALVLASVCRSLACDENHSRQNFHTIIAKEFLESVAQRFEKLAYHVLEHLANTGVANPAEYLHQTSERWNLKSILHLALDLECKTFVTLSAKFYRIALDSYFMRPSPMLVGDACILAEDEKQINYSFMTLCMIALRLKRCAQDLTLWEFYSIPYIKAITHGFSRMCFLILYAYVVFSSDFTYGRFSLYEVALFIYALSLAHSEWKQYRARGTFTQYLDFWNAVDMTYITILILAIICGWCLTDTVDRSNSAWKHGLEVVHAINLLPSFVKIFQVFLLSEYFGTLMLAIKGMIVDIAHFSVLLFGFCITFSAALTPIIFRDSQERAQQGLSWALWTVFGDIDGVAREKIDTIEWISLWMFARALFYCLSMFSNVLLVNLLITIMGDTYGQLKEVALTEWSFYQANAILEYVEAEVLPPPFNLLEPMLPWQQTTIGRAQLQRKLRQTNLILGKHDLQVSAIKALHHIGQEDSNGKGRDIRMQLLEDRVKELEVTNAQLKQSNIENGRLEQSLKEKIQQLEYAVAQSRQQLKDERLNSLLRNCPHSPFPFSRHGAIRPRSMPPSRQ